MSTPLIEAAVLRSRLNNPAGWWISPDDDGGLSVIRRADDRVVTIEASWLKSRCHEPGAVRMEIERRLAATECETCGSTGRVTTDNHGTMACPDCSGRD